MQTQTTYLQQNRITAAGNSTYIACRTSGSSRQEIVTLNIVNINKHKGTNAARNIAAKRYRSFLVRKKMDRNLKRKK